MVDKRRVKEVYVKGTAYTQPEMDYINQAVKFIPYEIDVIRATILIPPDHADNYRDNLHALHLVNQFGFTAQITIDAKLIEVTAFSPIMRSAPVKSSDEPEPITMPKRGEIWKDTNDATRKYIDKVDEKAGTYRVKFLNSLLNDKTFKASDIEFLIRSGYMVRESK